MNILDKEKIKELIPHREPMLLVDEIIIEDDNTIRGSYLFTGQEFFFKGHYPNNPITPGVILCEVMAQVSCGILANKMKGKTPYIVSISNAKFRKMVQPKDNFNVISNLYSTKGSFYYVKCKGYINEVLCAESEFSFIIR